MNLNKSIIAASLSLAGLLSVSLPAMADIYGGSSLEIDELRIRFTNSAGADASGSVTLNSFNFGSTNTAALNGVLSGTTASCNSVGTCGVAPAPVLNAGAANAPGSTGVTRIDNQTSGGDASLTWFGIDAGTNWANSDSVIYTSEITSSGANPTKAAQIAEAKITTATSALANSELTSNTSLTFHFTIGVDPTNFSLSFLADPDMQARIRDDLGIAQSTMAVSVNLSKDGGFGTGLLWTPDGTIADNCLDGGGVVCSEADDSQNLNVSLSTSTNNTEANHSFGANILGKTLFGINASGLTAGNWTLSLRGFVSTNLTRSAVSEPGVLALLGIALTGMGIAGRRRSLKK